MAKSNKKGQRILLDADVIIHFSKGGNILLLSKIFPQALLVLDKVLNELRKKSSFIQDVSNMLLYGIFEEIAFPETNAQVLTEYARLIKEGRGAGESACMAYCRFNQDILASSNLRDIQVYCQQHNITYVTTMDFLAEAYKRNVMTESECDEFIYNVKSKGSKLPCNTIKDYVERQK